MVSANIPGANRNQLLPPFELVEGEDMPVWTQLMGVKPAEEFSDGVIDFLHMGTKVNPDIAALLTEEQSM